MGKVCHFLRYLRSSKVLENVMKAIVVAVLAAAFMYAAGQYSVCISDWMNLPSFVIIFVGGPLGVSVLAWNRKWISRWIWLVVIVTLIVSLFQYGSKISLVHTEPEHYLQEKSVFNQAAAQVLPDSKEISRAEAMSYYHEKAVFSPFEIIELTIRYSEESLEQEISAVQRKLLKLKNSWSGAPYYFAEDTEDMYLYGHKYMPYIFSIEGIHYVIAYSVCVETNEITYLFFTNDCISFMTVYDALMAVKYQWHSCL